MANNRIYLKCRGCGETFFLGKRLDSGYYITDYPEYKGIPLKYRLNNFYDKHYFCNDFGPDCFDLEYEFEPERGGTNADRIRAMTDEELAELLTAYKCVDCILFSHDCKVEETMGSGKTCEELILDWLREEAKDDRMHQSWRHNDPDG